MVKPFQNEASGMGKVLLNLGSVDIEDFFLLGGTLYEVGSRLRQSSQHRLQSDKEKPWRLIGLVHRIVLVQGDCLIDEVEV